jgi:putative transcriptional regulator
MMARPSMGDGTVLLNRMRRLRFERGEMTQQELADQVGVTRHTIMAMEGGKYNPSLLVALKVARVFGVTVEDVFQIGGAD